MSDEKTLEVLFQSILKTFPNIKIYNDGRVNTGFATVRKQKFLETTIMEHIKKNQIIDLAFDTSIDLIYMFAEYLHKKTEDDKLRNLKSSEFQHYKFSHLVPVIDLRDANSKFLWNTKNKCISDVDVEVFKTMTGAKENTFVPSILEFNPYSLESMSTQDFEGIPTNFINLYFPPPWHHSYLSEIEIDSLECPEIIMEFMEHLIPDDECRDFVFDWIHFCLVKRCETYLVLNGAKGLGKNVLVEQILSSLVGSKHFNIAPESALESNFNSYLAGKRLILLDEVKIDTPPKVNKLKRYINEDQNIEKKGVDADKKVKTFNSFIISNNGETDVVISWDDRRFSVADLGFKRLEDVWPKEKINRMIDLLKKDEKFLAQFGFWIFYRQPKVMRDEFSVWKGKHFYKLCYTSLPEWAKVITDLITSGQYEYIEMADIKKEYRKRTDSNRIPRPQKIEDFLTNYRHDGKHTIGTIKFDDNGDFKIFSSKDFYKATGEGASSDDWKEIL